MSSCVLGIDTFYAYFSVLGKDTFYAYISVVAKQSICCGVELQTEHKKLLYVGVVKLAGQRKTNERTIKNTGIKR